MTENYKKELLNYLIGQLNNEEPKDKEIIKNIKESNNFEEWENFLPDTENLFFNGLIQLSTSENLVLYGEYIEKDGIAEKNSRGIIILLNSNLKPISTIYEFNSGTKLRPIQHMIQIEDGTFVGVDCAGFGSNIDRSNNAKYEKRFIMINNFTINNNMSKNYNPILRISYKFENDYSNFRCVKIFKNPNSAHYVMIGLRYINKGTYHHDGVGIIDFKINVGSANEWSLIKDDDSNWVYGGSYCEFNEDDKAFWEIVLTHNIASVTLNLWTKDFNDNTSVRQIMAGTGVYVDSIALNNQCVFINKNEMYFVVNNERWGDTEIERHLCLYKYNKLTNNLKSIKSFNLGTGDYNKFRDSIFLDMLDNNLYINYCTNVSLTSYTADYYFQRLEDDIWNPTLISEKQPYYMEYRFFYVNKNFNLVSGKSFPTVLNKAFWYFLAIFEIYNISNYNSLPYISENSLIQNSVELYSDNDIVFARNIHNLTINDNMTISAVEIPNTYLNNINLTKKLISKTNLVLINSDDIFQKNVYETVFLNFINFLQIIDRNNNNNKFNSEASSFLNNAVNTENNYDKTKLYNKAILYYQNGSSKEILYEYQNKQDYSVNIVLAISVDDYLDRLELVSNDKTTVYQTIDLSTLEIGKYYNINQKLEVI